MISDTGLYSHRKWLGMAIAKQVPDAKLVALKGTGHVLDQEQGATVADVVRFLGGGR